MILDHVITHREFRWLGVGAGQGRSLPDHDDPRPGRATASGVRREAEHHGAVLPRQAARLASHPMVDSRVPVPPGEPATARLPSVLAPPCGTPARTARMVDPAPRPGRADRQRRPSAGPCRPLRDAPFGTSSARHWIRSPRTSCGGSGRPARSLRAGEDKRMRRARRIFGTPRFRALRRALELDGERAVDVAMSRSLADAIERREGRFERHEMRRQYFRLSHLVGTA